jgi:uncharacterized protein (AIM24 family)
MISTILENIEKNNQENEKFVMQTKHMLLVNLNGSIYTKQGAMSAYQGEMEFQFHGGGAKRMFKKIITGENLNLMECSGRGDLFLADNGADVHIVKLENEELTVNSTNLLAFESELSWDVKRIKAGVMGLVAGGLFNTTISGSGLAAVTSWGQPVVLEVNEPTYVDVNCAIAWSTSLDVSIHSSFKAGSIIGRGSGEAFQMKFEGKGFVIVQPGEGLYAMVAMASTGRR